MRQFIIGRRQPSAGSTGLNFQTLDAIVAIRRVVKRAHGNGGIEHEQGYCRLRAGRRPAGDGRRVVAGMTSSVSKDGVAFGTAINYKSEEEARKAAIDYCHKFKGAPKASAQCRVVGTFKDKCYAISMDPKAGTPGAGWSIAAIKSDAEDHAVTNCKATAGSDGRQFCVVQELKCDGGKS
jgi:hypothetical protein